MNQLYNVVDHGDLLEKEAATFIQTRFPNYEKVWQIYIGNTGRAERAALPHYPDEDKRRSFAEHSYTTLESCFMIRRILDSKVFESEINSFIEYIEFNKSFITFFAYLGRIHDTVIKASYDLKYDNSGFIQKVKEFYQARNIVIHGRKVPIVFDECGLVKMPLLQTESVKGRAWNDKNNSWADIKVLPTEYVADNCERYFEDLLALINNEYGRFLDLIYQELKAIPTSLTFDRSWDGILFTNEDILPPSSGSTSITASSSSGVDIYKIKESFKAKRTYDIHETQAYIVTLDQQTEKNRKED